MTGEKSMSPRCLGPLKIFTVVHLILIHPNAPTAMLIIVDRLALIISFTLVFPHVLAWLYKRSNSSLERRMSHLSVRATADLTKVGSIHFGLNMNMFWIKFITLVLAVQFSGIEGQLEIYYEDIVMENINSEYIKDAEAHINADSENGDSLFVNFTIIKALPTTAQGHLELVAASMGEYVMPTGLVFDLDICDLIDEPVLIGPFLKSIGFTAEDCPPPMGVYTTTEYRPPIEELPPELRPNKYKVIFDMVDQDIVILRVVFYVEIQ
ncbi:uncharacterized protein LOC135166815 [Diachasmimorpha longicaudata]|uniref:uncharacterized protein LOC135166815 n=1 Tax=Diachasmimorpha longicaudata TaxID=58733 RepID=UPI0030B8DD62